MGDGSFHSVGVVLLVFRVDLGAGVSDGVARIFHYGHGQNALRCFGVYGGGEYFGRICGGFPGEEIEIAFWRAGVGCGAWVDRCVVFDSLERDSGERSGNGGAVYFCLFVWDCEFELLDAGAERGAAGEGGAGDWFFEYCFTDRGHRRTVDYRLSDWSAEAFCSCRGDCGDLPVAALVPLFIAQKGMESLRSSLQEA